MDDRILALCELSNDLLFQKIPKSRLSYYVDASLNAGRETAKRFAGQNIRQLYEERRIGIQVRNGGKKGYGVVLRGQAVMAREGCSVELYKDSLDALAQHSAYGGQSLTQEAARDTHLAHEFFHILEYMEGRSLSEELEPIVRFSFLGLSFKSRINRCDEIAAHAFAKEFLGLPYLPNFYDYLYLTGTGAMTQSDFSELTGRMAVLLSENI